MLVLTRKAGEKVVIGDGIMLTVVQVDGHRVRVGIEAPANVRILRAELAETPDEADPVNEPLLVDLGKAPAESGSKLRSPVRVKSMPR